MSNNVLPLGPVRALFLLLMLAIIACGGTTVVSTEIPVDQAVAQTLAARDAVELQVAQTLAALAPIPTEVPAVLPTELPAELPAGGDVADPNANVPLSQPVVDPNLAGGTPQLRVTTSSANVRSGPGTNYPPIATLRQEAVVVVAAKNSAGTWFLIELPGGVRGWISTTVTAPVMVADMSKVVIAVTIPAPPLPTAVSTTRPAAATSTATPTATATRAASPTPGATTVATMPPTATTPPTATALPTETATPTEPSPVISVIINVQNNSSIEICFLFIDLSSGPWTSDRLGPTETILPGGQVSLSFPTGEYDFMAQDCNNNIIADLYNVQVGGGFTWVVQ